MSNELKVLLISTSLKPESESTTLKLAYKLAAQMKELHPVVTEMVHIASMCVPPGVKNRVSKADDWPSIAEKIFASDIVLFATPIWWGNRSSLMQRVIERMDSFTDAGGFPGRGGLGKMVGKVAGIVITGGEDGAQSVQAHLMEALTWFGFALPPLCTYFELGGNSDLREKGLTATAQSLVKAALAVKTAYTEKPDAEEMEITFVLAEDKTLKYNQHGRPTTDNPKAKLPVV